MKNDYGIPISLFPSENLQLKGEKKGKISLYLLSVKNESSRLNLFSFFYLFSIFLFLELRVRVRVTRSHSHSNSHKSQSHIEGYRRFWKDDIIQHVQYMLTLRHIHGCLE